MRLTDTKDAIWRRGGIVVGAATLLGAFVGPSATAAPNPVQMPKGTRVQCAGFFGPNAQWPHHLTGCTRNNGTTGTGQTTRTAPGTETIAWNAPFVNGKSMQLTNITNSQVTPPTGACPADHPAEVTVAGVIGADSMWAGSPVTATICGNATDFVLKPGALFVIGKPAETSDSDDSA